MAVAVVDTEGPLEGVMVGVQSSEAEVVALALESIQVTLKEGA